MAAGRSLPGWAVGLSILGTYVSSIGFLGNTGKAFSGNWNSWVFGLSLPIAGLIAVKWFIPHYRSSDNLSAYSHLEVRFGPWARIYALVCYLLSQLARVGTILFLVALALNPLTGWGVVNIILVTGFLVTLYTLIGGIEAVIWTDVVQSIVLIAGAFLCVVLLLTGMPEGSSQLFSIANENNKFDLGSFDPSFSSFLQETPTFWIVLIYGIFINLTNFGIDQNFVQRYFTAKSLKEARKSIWIAVIIFPIISAVFFFIGTSIFSLYEADPTFKSELQREVAITLLEREGVEATEAAIQVKAQTLTEKEISDRALPHFIVNKLPLGLAGLLIAAIFAAAMSSMDTSLNSSATVIYCDIYKRYFNPEASEKSSMRFLYITTFVIGVLGTGTAIAMLDVKSALDAWWNLQGVFTGGMLGLFLLGLISKKAKNPHAVCAAILGISLIAWLSLSKTDLWPDAWEGGKNPFHSFMTIVIGTSSIVLIGVLLSAFLKPHESTENGS